MNNLPISLLIPTMNRPDSLKHTIESFLRCSYIPSEIIIVDQSSGDNFKMNKSIVVDANRITKIIHIFQNSPSLTKARNIAIENANYDLVVFADDDIEANENTLLNVFKDFQIDGVSMIGGFDDCAPKSKGILGYLLGFKSFKNRFIGHVTKSVFGRFPIMKKDNIVNTMWAMGFFFAVKKSLIHKWGLRWDERLTGYAYAEDLDFSYSYYQCCKKNGLKCIMDKNISVKHLCSNEYRTPSRKSTFMYIQNRAYLSYKHSMGKKSSFWMAITNRVILLKRALRNETPKDMRDAIKYSKKHKFDIRKGIFNYDL